MRKGIFKNPMRRWGWLFLGPVTLAFIIGFVWPFFQGIYLSFNKFKVITKTTWVGFANYSKALADPSFMHAFWYTALFALVSLLLINILGFAVAYVLTQGIRGSNLFRTVFFMPNLIGGIVLGYIWSMIFDGILSRYGTSILLNQTYGFWGLIILMCWQQIGYVMIIYIAGLQAVPEDMLEAAKIDGAGHLTIFFRIALPLSVTALLTVGLMYALNYWNDWWHALMFIDNRDLYPLQYYLYSIMSNVNAVSSGRVPSGAAANIRLPAETVKMAVTIITIGPIIFLYPFIQRYFVKGIMMGAVKE